LDLSVLRRTAAEIAAAAIYETYPDVLLRGGGETATGFTYEFFFPHPIHPHLIEEKMKAVVREKRPIRTLDMVAFSAYELLKAQGHFERAEELAGETGMVQVIQIGTFHDLSTGPHLKNTAELAAFKINAEPLPEQGMRITGWCHQSKEDLKTYLKQVTQYRDPQQIGEEQGFWKGKIWLPLGLEKREKLIHFLKKKWFSQALQVSVPKGEDRLALHRSLAHPKVAEIGSDEQGEIWMQISFFGPSEGEFISFLQLIGKTLTILGFDHSQIPMGREGDYWVLDGLGRNHSLVQVKRVSKKGSPTVDYVVTAKVEEILKQMLEKNRMMVELENQ
jgi:threonyl-tRNA synthetase